jgi:hypothetical protein
MRWKYTKTGITELILSALVMHSATFANNPSLLTPNNSTLLSSTENETKARNLENRVSSLEQKRGGLLNPPARPLVEDFDFNLFGDLLIWQAHENGLPIAIKNKATNFTTISGYQNFQDASVKHLDFDYDVGFRLGINFDTMYDGWDVSLTWLRFDADADAKTFASGNKELFPSRLDGLITAFIGDSDNFAGPDPLPIYAKAHSRWKSFLNQLDLDLGREFFVSKHLTLRPHFGLRTTWLRQYLNTKYTDGIAISGHPTMTDTSVHEKNKWWGLGLVGGLDSSWMFCHGFGLYGKLAAAIEYGFTKVRAFQDVEDPIDLTFENLKDSSRISRPILDLELGIKWDHSFSDNSYNFGLHAGWEHHVYFSQNQFHAQESLGQFTANQGDLTYNGWTLGAHLAF